MYALRAMSHKPQGEDWWLATDGKWYPPDERPQPSQPTASGSRTQVDTGKARESRRAGGKWWRVTGWLGVAYFVLMLILFVLTAGTPFVGDSPSNVREYFTDNDSIVYLSGFVGGLANLGVFLAFASGIRGVLARADRQDAGMWSRFSFAGAVTAVAFGGVGGAMNVVLSLTAEQASDGTLLVLSALGVAMFTVFGLGAAVFLAGAAFVILKSGVFQRWLAWLGLAGAVLLVVGSLWPFEGDSGAAFGTLGFGGLILFLIWTLVAGIDLVRRTTPEMPAAAGDDSVMS